MARKTFVNNSSTFLLNKTQLIENKILFLGKKYLIDISVEKLNIHVIEDLLKATKKTFQLFEILEKDQSFPVKTQQADRNLHRIMLCQKQIITFQSLQRRISQLLFIIFRQISSILHACRFHEDCIDYALLLASAYNQWNNQDRRKNRGVGVDVQVCSNSYTTLCSRQNNIHIKYILQIISFTRSEILCSELISSLLVTYELDTSYNNSESDTSSVEILKTLTTQMLHSVPNDTNVEPSHQLKHSKNPATPNTDTNILECLLSDEEVYYANLTTKCLTLCPSAFEEPLATNQLVKWVKRGTHTLWTQVGATLDHVVLWWCNTPLAGHPVISAIHLRTWLLYMYPDDVPGTIVSILNCLGESLTTYVTSISWDKQFRLTLVSSNLPVDYVFESSEFYNPKFKINGLTTSGCLWSELFCTLSSSCNTCDEHDAAPSELPIIEQITILHRLDHSIHTARLWAVCKAKTLCIEWNMEMFFKVAQNDVNQCLHQIKVIQVPDLMSTAQYEEQIKVTVSLRAKLISEIKVNVCKLQLTYSDCIKVLAAICKTLSLATLNMCFPQGKHWQTKQLQEHASEYTSKFLDEIFLPIVSSTNVLEVPNLILKIMCESWLDHIFMQKIKFSHAGALNLLKDFEGVSEWINNCECLSPEFKKILSKHEILKTCEGVGKILLRQPYEVISMINSTPKSSENYENEQGAYLPPEMYVPDQKRWLQLRAGKQHHNCLNVLCGDCRILYP